MTNARHLVSRNKREGLYCGYSKKHFRLNPSKFFIKNGLETLRRRWNLYWALEYGSTLDEKYYTERYKS
jgi:hypothetical protein